MNVTIIGTGYVGLVTGVALSHVGHKVTCVGRNKEKIDEINVGIAPFYEPGLEALLKKMRLGAFLQASIEFEKSVLISDVIIIAVGTPTIGNKIDLTSIKKVAIHIGKSLSKDKKYRLIIVKSTVLPTVTEKVVRPLIEKYSKKNIGEFGLCMNPEFLREGNAVEDAIHPDRIVIGAFDEKSGKMARKLYKAFDCPKVITSLSTAEMIKYAANSLFATMISFSNEIANICSSIEGVDVQDVWKGVHLDSRLSPKVPKGRITPGMLSYIQSGCGYGGSCFPKDVKALSHFAKEQKVSHEILKSVISVNESQPKQIISLLLQAIGSAKNKKIAILGLAFKPNTDDLRESPSLIVISELLQRGARVVAHDPVVYSKGKRKELEAFDISYVQTYEEALKKSDAVIVMTSWDEYIQISPSEFIKEMKSAVVIDGRRIYNKEQFIHKGIIYKGVGLSLI